MYTKSAVLYLALTAASVTAQGMPPPGQGGMPPDQMGFGGPQRQPPKEVLEAKSKFYSYNMALATKSEFSSVESVLATAVPESVLEQFDNFVPPEGISTAAWYQALPQDVKSYMSSVASEVASIIAPIVSAGGGIAPGSTMDTFPAGGPVPGSGPKGMGPKATAPAGSNAPSLVVSSTTTIVTPASSVASTTTTASGTSSSTAKNGTAKNDAALMHTSGVGGILGSIVGVAGVVFGGAILL